MALKKKKKKSTEELMGTPKIKKAKGKIIGMGLCIITAGVICFVLLPAFYASQSEIDKVAVLTQDVAKGEELTEKNTAMKEIGTYGLPSDVILDLDEAIGSHAQLAMKKGDFLTEEKVGETGDSAAIAKLLAEGKRLISISVDTNASAVSGHLQPGDIVDVYTMGKDANAAPVKNQILQNIRVYDVENSDTASTENIRNKADDEDLKETIAATITFEATEAQADALIAAEKNGGIHVVLVKRSENEKRTEAAKESGTAAETDASSGAQTEGMIAEVDPAYISAGLSG